MHMRQMIIRSTPAPPNRLHPPPICRRPSSRCAYLQAGPSTILQTSARSYHMGGGWQPLSAAWGGKHLTIPRHPDKAACGWTAILGLIPLLKSNHPQLQRSLPFPVLCIRPSCTPRSAHLSQHATSVEPKAHAAKAHHACPGRARTRVLHGRMWGLGHDNLQHTGCGSRFLRLAGVSVGCSF